MLPPGIESMKQPSCYLFLDCYAICQKLRNGTEGQYNRILSYLDRVVVRAEREVVPAAERRILRAHMHLEVLEEVLVLVRRERHKHAHRAGQSRVDQRLAATRDQRRFLRTRKRGC
jgi:hypothetical protein